MRFHLRFALISVLFVSSAFAATKYLQGNSWKSADLSKTFTPPSATDTLVGRASTDTLTNKSISGSTNTLTNISLSSSVTGLLGISNGGTGESTANGAFNALAPSQATHSGKFLTTNGTNTSWANIDAFPSQTGNAGKFLKTDGSTTSWDTASVTAQGAYEVSGTTITKLRAPYNQMITIGSNERLLETGSENWAYNSGFESSTITDGITLGSGVTSAAETSIFRQGLKSLKLTLSSNNGTTAYASVPINMDLGGMHLQSGIQIRTTMTTLRVCPLLSGSVVTTACTSVNGDDKWHDYYPNSVGSSSDTSVGWELQTTSSSSGTVYIDTSRVGPAWNIGTVAQAYHVGSITWATTASCEWGTASTSYTNFSADADCPTPTTTGSLVAPGTKIPAFSIPTMPSGVYRFEATCGFKAGVSAASSSFFRFHDGTSGTEDNRIGINSAIDTVWNRINGTYTVATPKTTSTTFNIQAMTNNAGSAAELEPSCVVNVYYEPSQSTGTTAVNMNQLKAPTIQKFTSGSGTYTLPTGVTHIRVRMVGGGAGGNGSSTSAASNGGAGGAGGNTTFGSSLLTANGGAAGNTGGSTVGSAGGTATCNSPATCLSVLQGARGGGATYMGSGSYPTGATGGVSPFGGAGSGNAGTSTFAGLAAVANTGSGGGGGGGENTGTISGPGGGAGGYIEASITSPSATYSYAVGAGGTAGSAGTSGAAGGAGGSGYIEVTEYYAWNMPLVIGGVQAKDNTNGSTVINTVVSKSADYTATDQEETILVDSSGATRTITLPAAAGVKGKKYEIVQTSSTNQVIIDPNSSETVCGQTTIRLSGIRDSVIVQSDGTNWQGLHGACEKTARIVFGGSTVGNSNCTSASCTIHYSDLAGVSASRSAGGTYSASIPSGAYSGPPAVSRSGVIIGTGPSLCGNNLAPLSATSVGVSCYPAGSASGSDSQVELILRGPR